MLDYEKVWQDKPQGELPSRIIDFHCENCQSQFSENSLNLATFLYGLIYLGKKGTSYIGITCPNCLTAILIKECQYPSDLFNRLSAWITFGNSQFHMKLTYFSSIYHHNIVNQHLQSLRPYNINYFQTSLSDDRFDQINEAINSHVVQNDLADHLCSFSVSDGQTDSIETFTLYVDEKHLEDLVRYEQDNNVRIIPRYIHQLNLFDQIEEYCARYGFGSPLERLIPAAKTNLEELERESKEKTSDPSEIIGNNPSILHPEILENYLVNEHSGDDAQFRIASDLMEILAADPYPWDFPSKDQDWIVDFWKRPHPFKDQGVPMFWPDPKNSYSENNTQSLHREMVDEVEPLFSKGYVQKFLSNQYSGFIKEYSQLVSKYALSYADIWDLKERYLARVYQCVRDKKATRPSFNHRNACRQVAKKIWSKKSDITIADMCVSDEISEACDGILYPEATLRKWIKDLCPDRSPGRRPKKKAD